MLINRVKNFRLIYFITSQLKIVSEWLAIAFTKESSDNM